MSLWNRHKIFEKNSIILIAGILVVIAIGGLVEITPLFYLKSTIEVVDGVRPYTPLELTGRSMYVHPFQWGSKRTGPDLARVGAKYSDEWHVRHLIDPRAIVPQSVMPGYPTLAETEVNLNDIAAHLRTSRAVGVPYTEDQLANARADLLAQ